MVALQNSWKSDTATRMVDGNTKISLVKAFSGEHIASVTMKELVTEKFHVPIATHLIRFALAQKRCSALTLLNGANIVAYHERDDALFKDVQPPAREVEFQVVQHTETPRKNTTVLRTRHEDDGAEEFTVTRPLKKRKLTAKMPKDVLYRPAFLTTALTAHYEFCVQCERCLAVADKYYFLKHDWMTDDLFDECVWMNKGICKNCEPLVVEEEQAFVAHCALCERPLWMEDCHDENVRYQDSQDENWDELWCSYCSMNHSGNFTGA